jgi:DNA-binding transcriptional MerR regulator
MDIEDAIASRGLPIASVERETGLSKDTLRVWERRYGFPTPERDAKGERLYTQVQVRRLAQIKRLMDRGHRPGKLLALDEPSLRALDDTQPLSASAPGAGHLDNWLQLVKAHDSEALQRQFYRELAKRGMPRFVQDTIAPLITRIGEAWSRNELGVFEEHLFSQHLEKLFRTTLANLPPQAGRPRVLLTTLSGEEHTLGLLMVIRCCSAQRPRSRKSCVPRSSSRWTRFACPSVWPTRPHSLRRACATCASCCLTI